MLLTGRVMLRPLGGAVWPIFICVSYWR